MIKIHSFLLFITTALFLSACAGGDDAATPTPSPAAVSGTFHDSAVSGLEFTCGDASGITDRSGRFQCPVSATDIIFKIG